MKGSTLRVFIDLLERTLTHSDISTLALVLGHTVDVAGNKRSRLLALIQSVQKEPSSNPIQPLIDEYVAIVGNRSEYRFQVFMSENLSSIQQIAEQGYAFPDDWNISAPHPDLATSSSSQTAVLSKNPESSKADDLFNPSPQSIVVKGREMQKADNGIFISHSSTDRLIAKALVNLIEATVVLPATNLIRCTSLPGYGIPTGALTSETLRNDLSGAAVVVGLITQNSLRSSWVLFELGAAWGSNTWTVPIVAPDIDLKELPGPLKERNAVKTNNKTDIAQFLSELISHIHYPTRSMSRQVEALDDYLSAIRLGMPD